MSDLKKEGYYITLGVNGKDTIYFGLKSEEDFNKATQAILKSQLNADVKLCDEFPGEEI